MEIKIINTVNRKKIDSKTLYEEGKKFYNKFSNDEQLPKYGNIDALEFLSFIEGFVEARRIRMNDFGYTEEFINKTKNVSSHDIGMIANSFDNSEGLIGVMAIVMVSNKKKPSQAKLNMLEGLKYAKRNFDYYESETLNKTVQEDKINSIW